MDLNNTTELARSSVLTVGQRLRAAREAKGLSLRDMAAITKIQASMLGYLEEDRYDELPAEVFARGFLRNYARDLRLNEVEILDLYRSQTGALAPVVARVVETEPVRERFIDAHKLASPSNISRVAYAAGLAVLVLGLALSVLVFGGDDAPGTASNIQPTDFSNTWQPVPAGENDWQTYREN